MRNQSFTQTAAKVIKLNNLKKLAFIILHHTGCDNAFESSLEVIAEVWLSKSCLLKVNLYMHALLNVYRNAYGLLLTQIASQCIY